METEGRVSSKPVFRRHRDRTRAYLDWESGEGITDGGEDITTSERAPLSRLLSDLPREVEQLFICGELPGGAEDIREWATKREVISEWEDRGIHPDPSAPVIRLRRRRDGRNLTLYSIGPWFGEEVSPRAARTAFGVLEELLGERFYGARVLPTPAQTGLDLWDRRRSGSEYPVLDEELRDLISANITQGRSHTTPPPGISRAPGHFYLDKRWAYASFTSGMPVGEPTLDTRNEYVPYRPGFYLIDFRVPEGWDHVGLFPVKAVEGGKKTWRFPESPGESGQCWVGDRELAQGERFGWSYEIRQRLLFSAPGRGSAPEPLKAWRDNLVSAREKADELGRNGDLSAQVAEAVSGAVRNILIFAIGSFHRRERLEWRTLTAEEVPHHVPPEREGDLIPAGGGLVYYPQEEKLTKDGLIYAHPEWSATIWSRTRASLLYFHTKAMVNAGEGPRGALTLPREDVLGFRNDALALARDPGWGDGGKIGEFKLKGAIREAVDTPHTLPELDALNRRAEEEYANE